MPAFRDAWAPVLAHLAAPLVGELAAGPPGPWLDLGCGVGTLARDLDSAGGPPSGLTVGVDIFREMLAAARSVHPRLVPVQGDAARLPFGDRVFGRVLAAFMLHHVREQWRALAEVHRVLREDGRFGLAVWGAHDPGGPAFDAWETCLERAGAPPLDPAPSTGWSEAIDTPFRLGNLLKEMGFAACHIWEEERAWTWEAADLAHYLGHLGGPARRLETLPPNRQAACRAAGRLALERLSPGERTWRPRVVFGLAGRGPMERHAAGGPIQIHSNVSQI